MWFARATPVAAAFVLAGSFTSVAAADEGGRQWDTTLAYTCTSPSGGTYDAHLRVTATLPGKVAPGKQIKPDGVALGITLPVAALLPADGAAQAGSSSGSQAVAGTAELKVAVAQEGVRGKPTDAAWSGLSIPDTTLPARGDAELTAKGPVPWVRTSSSGDLTFTAGDLRLALAAHPSAASDAADSQGAPAATDVRCSLAPGQDATLATVAVPSPRDGSASASPSATQRPRAKGTPAPEAAAPKAAGGPRIGFDPAADCTVLFGQDVPPPEHLGDGYIGGYANVNKLKGAVFLSDPAHLVKVNLVSRFEVLNCPPSDFPLQSRIFSEAHIDYHGKSQFPPARGTFLTFGFVPTTATVELTVDGPVQIKSHPRAITDENVNEPRPEVFIADSKVRIRVYNVKVNGTPLDVGPDCRTVRPMDQRLYALGTRDPITSEVTGYQVTDGGLLEGYSDIPPFTGCGVGGDDLDNLFTASLSGNGNLTKLTQAPLCVPEPSSTNFKYCPDPPRPKPER